MHHTFKKSSTTTWSPSFKKGGHFFSHSEQSRRIYRYLVLCSTFKGSCHEVTEGLTYRILHSIQNEIHFHNIFYFLKIKWKLLLFFCQKNIILCQKIFIYKIKLWLAFINKNRILIFESWKDFYLFFVKLWKLEI